MGGWGSGGASPTQCRAPLSNGVGRLPSPYRRSPQCIRDPNPCQADLMTFQSFTFHLLKLSPHLSLLRETPSSSSRRPTKSIKKNTRLKMEFHFATPGRMYLPSLALEPHSTSDNGVMSKQPPLVQLSAPRSSGEGLRQRMPSIFSMNLPSKHLSHSQNGTCPCSSLPSQQHAQHDATPHSPHRGINDDGATGPASAGHGRALGVA